MFRLWSLIPDSGLKKNSNNVHHKSRFTKFHRSSEFLVKSRLFSRSTKSFTNEIQGWTSKANDAFQMMLSRYALPDSFICCTRNSSLKPGRFWWALVDWKSFLFPKIFNWTFSIVHLNSKFELQTYQRHFNLKRNIIHRGILREDGHGKWLEVKKQHIAKRPLEKNFCGSKIFRMYSKLLYINFVEQVVWWIFRKS